MADLLKSIRLIADEADRQLQRRHPNSHIAMRTLKMNLTRQRDLLRLLYVEHSGEDPWSPEQSNHASPGE